jgi:hypothetical protein
MGYAPTQVVQGRHADLQISAQAKTREADTAAMLINRQTMIG